MNFADAGQLEQHLNNDWTLILKNVKAKEDLHFELLQYNRRIVNRQRLEDDELFINDQILMHQAQINKAQQVCTTMQKEEREVIEKYEGSIVSYDQIIKLMVRVGARILETYQYSIDKCKSLDEELIEKHSKVKTVLIKLLNQKGQINLQQVINLVINYTKNKLLNEVERLKRIVAALENGECSKMQEMYEYKQKKIPPPLTVSTQKNKISLEKAKVLSVGREERSPLREEIKMQQKIKKQKQKVAVKLAHGLYSMMELSRQQFIEDVCCNERQKANRLYNEIFVRNKSNYDQIKAFEAKKDEFHEKVRLFKEMMERESRRIAQAIAQKQLALAKKRESQLRVSQQTSNEEIKLQSQSLLVEDMYQDQATERKHISNRYRIQYPKSKREFRQIQSNLTNVLHNQQDFTHFKFDTSNQEIYPRTNRNRLPNIHNQNNLSQCVNRTTSLDQRVELNITKIFRNQQKLRRNPREDIDNEEVLRSERVKDKGERYIAERGMFAMKNIEIGVGDASRKQERSHAGRQRKKIEPHPMQYTFYVRKSNKKFYQAKLSGLL